MRLWSAGASSAIYGNAFSIRGRSAARVGHLFVCGNVCLGARVTRSQCSLSRARSIAPADRASRATLQLGVRSDAHRFRRYARCDHSERCDGLIRSLRRCSSASSDQSGGDWASPSPARSIVACVLLAKLELPIDMRRLFETDTLDDGSWLAVPRVCDLASVICAPDVCDGSVVMRPSCYPTGTRPLRRAVWAGYAIEVGQSPPRFGLCVSDDRSFVD